MKVVLNVPVTIGEQPYAAGAEIDVDDATAYDLRMDGKAALPYDPKTAEQGNYTSSTGRSALGGESTPVPQATSKQSGEAINAPERTKR